MIDTQEQRILNFFNYNRDANLTPPQVKDAVGLTCPLTSVRRALTVLTTKGKLQKNQDTSDGLFGHPNHKWSLPTQFEVVESQARA